MLKTGLFWLLIIEKWKITTSLILKENGSNMKTRISLNAWKIQIKCLIKTHLKKADMHMFVAAIEELLDLQFSVEDVLVDSFRRRTSSWGPQQVQRRFRLHLKIHEIKYCKEELILLVNLHLYVFSTIIQINQIKSTSYVVCITRENRINFFIIASGEVPNFSWYG